MSAHAACLWLQLEAEGRRPAPFALRRDHALVLVREVVFETIGYGHCLPPPTEHCPF